MSDLIDTKMALFFPDYIEGLKNIMSGGIKFAYYTGAETAMKIIQNNEIWLRNTRGMNDYSEIEHGFESFRQAFTDSTEGKSFRDYINTTFPGTIEELVSRFDGWLPSIRQQTYIACVSMHERSDDAHGRLSMWRAYGGKKSIALVFNSKPFTNDTNALKTTFYQVVYRNDDYARQYLSGLESRMRDKHQLLIGMDSDELLGWLFEICKMMVLCVKHPGFKEEKEWRLIYSPDFEQSSKVMGCIESIGGVPQQVYKVGFENVPEENLTNATLPECLDRIIIGPSDDAPLLIDSFRKLLAEADVQDPTEKVFYSGIPLR
jgi:hypothetical protein